MVRGEAETRRRHGATPVRSGLVTGFRPVVREGRRRAREEWS
jgi:hypothetical protein